MSKSNPCVNICVHDRLTGLCVGCGRTVDEILEWRRLPQEDRSKILADLPRRMTTMTSRKTRGRGRNARKAAR